MDLLLANGFTAADNDVVSITCASTDSGMTGETTCTEGDLAPLIPTVVSSSLAASPMAADHGSTTNETGLIIVLAFTNNDNVCKHRYAHFWDR